MVVIYPLSTEKAINGITLENTLVFAVEKNAKRSEVKKEIEQRFSVKVAGVNIVISPRGEKKAYVKLAKGFSADEIAAKLKVI